jgi:hypothetical protein
MTHRRYSCTAKLSGNSWCGVVYHTQIPGFLRGFDQVNAVPHMSRKKSVVASLLLVLLLGTMTAAAWHHHDNAKFEKCQVCHLSEHALASPSTGPVVDGLQCVGFHGGTYTAPLRCQWTFSRADYRAPPA